MYQFGNFRLEPANGCLLRDGVRVPTEPKALRLLELLIESDGVLVDRDLLQDQLWGTDPRLRPCDRRPTAPPS